MKLLKKQKKEQVIIYSVFSLFLRLNVDIN
jgi:hypothetical protein